jgi:hypothetical protein
MGSCLPGIRLPNLLGVLGALAVFYFAPVLADFTTAKIEKR